MRFSMLVASGGKDREELDAKNGKNARCLFRFKPFDNHKVCVWSCSSFVSIVCR